jgi:hypothetical protein
MVLAPTIMPNAEERCHGFVSNAAFAINANVSSRFFGAGKHEGLTLRGDVSRSRTDFIDEFN